MERLIGFEFRKLFRRPAFYVCMGITVLLTLLAALTSYFFLVFIMDIIPDSEFMGDALIEAGINGRAYLMNAVSNGNVITILAVFIALFICEDYTDGAAKNVIGRGFGRVEWVLARYITAFVAALILTAVAMLSGFAIATIIGGPGEGWNIGTVGLIGLQVLLILGYTAMFTFFSLLVRKAGGAIALNLFVPAVITAALTLADTFIDSETFMLQDFWLGSIEGNYSLMVLTGDFEQEFFVTAPITAVVYLGLFVALSCLIEHRRDV
ncbi:MAG: ABC transporter permease [Lachnospiraceae bacterium]|nr:ABC transporter permease [Lachnospiraceae bacterium]